MPRRDRARDRYMRDRARRRMDRARGRDRGMDYAMDYRNGRSESRSRSDSRRGRDRADYGDYYMEYEQPREFYGDYNYDMRRGRDYQSDYRRGDRDYRGDYAEDDDYKEEYEEDLEKWQKKLKKDDRFGWSKEQVVTKARDMGVSFKDYDEDEYYTIYLMHVSDYPSVANEPHTYLAMAKAWLEDKDLEIDPSEKVCKYLYEIVMAEEE